MRCQRCDVENRDQAAFCKGCGVTLSPQQVASAAAGMTTPSPATGPNDGFTVCPMCGARVDPGAQFCAHCDQALQTGTLATTRSARRGASSGRAFLTVLGSLACFASLWLPWFGRDGGPLRYRYRPHASQTRWAHLNRLAGDIGQGVSKRGYDISTIGGAQAFDDHALRTRLERQRAAGELERMQLDGGPPTHLWRDPPITLAQMAGLYDRGPSGLKADFVRRDFLGLYKPPLRPAVVVGAFLYMIAAAASLLLALYALPRTDRLSFLCGVLLSGVPVGIALCNRDQALALTNLLWVGYTVGLLGGLMVLAGSARTLAGRHNPSTETG